MHGITAEKGYHPKTPSSEKRQIVARATILGVPDISYGEKVDGPFSHWLMTKRERFWFYSNFIFLSKVTKKILLEKLLSLRVDSYICNVLYPPHLNPCLLVGRLSREGRGSQE